MLMSMSIYRVVAIASAITLGVALAGQAEARSKRQGYRSAPPTVHVGGLYGANTYARAPRSYGRDPGQYRNVPRGRPDGFQAINGCYGGREQVLRGGRLVWVPNVTCPYAPDFF